MSDGLNRVVLLGNLGADPELRYTASGTAVLNLRLATSESYLDANKERQERTEWHTVVVWGARGEGLSKILKKGDRILIEGGLRTSSYEDREGVKRYKTEVHATNVVLAGGPRNEDGASGNAPRPASRSREAPARQPATAPSKVAPPPDDDFGGGFGSGSADDIPF